MTDEVGLLIEAGRAALKQGDTETARAAFTAALEHGPTGPILAGLAEAAFLEHDHATAIAHFEEAYAIYRDSDDPRGASRTAATRRSSCAS